MRVFFSLLQMSTNVWELPEFYLIDNEFFRSHEKKQLENAYRNFLINTQSRGLEVEDDDEENIQSIFLSKIQLFQLFLRSQPVNFRSFR